MLKTPMTTGHYSLRVDQVEQIRRLRDERPGASFSDIVRDVLDAGFREYEHQRLVLRSLERRPEPVPA